MTLVQKTKSLLGMAATVLAVGFAASFNAFAAPITSAGDPALAGATVIDFNSEPQSVFVSTTLGGVTISGFSGNLLNISSNSNNEYAPPPDTYLGNNGGSGDFRFSFGSPVSAFGLQIGATNDVWVMSAYDAGDNLLESINIPNQVATLPYPYAGFYGISTGGPLIARFTLNQANFDGDYIITDDLTFVVASVPEPGTLALLGLGLAGLAASRRRKQ